MKVFLMYDGELFCIIQFRIKNLEFTIMLNENSIR